MNTFTDERGRLTPTFYYMTVRGVRGLDGWTKALDIWQSWNPNWDFTEMRAALAEAERCVRGGGRFDESWLDQALDRVVAEQPREEVLRFSRELREASKNHFLRRISFGLLGTAPAPALALAPAPAAPAAPAPPAVRACPLPALPKPRRRPPPPSSAEDDDGAKGEAAAAGPRCCVCLSAPAVVAAIPCGHVLCCEGCHAAGGAPRGRPCYACRTAIAGHLRIFI